MPVPDTLHIESTEGAPTNEYRVVDGEVEFRIVDPQGGHIGFSRWRRLTPEDVLFHLSLDTIVGRWLLKRFGRESLPRAA